MIRDTFITVGLTPYESAALASLLTRGPMGARELSGRSEVPMGRIYSVTGALEDRGLVEVMPSRPKSYVALPVDVCLGKLEEVFMAGVDQRVLSFKDSIKRVADDISAARSGATDEGEWSAIFGEDSFNRMMVESMTDVEEDVLLVLPEGYQPNILDLDRGLLEASDREIGDALCRGVRIWIVDSNPFFFEHLCQVMSERGEDLSEVRGRLRYSRLCTDQAFIVIDRDKVFLEVYDRLDPSRLIGMFKGIDGSMATGLRQRFMELFEEGVEVGV